MKKTCLTALFLAALCAASHAGDSPQFRGPNRDGVFPGETGLMKAWPEGGPPLLWTATGFGVGYSSAAVSNGRVYLTGTLEGQESFLFVLNTDGKELDRIPYGRESDAETAPGARSTPTVEDGRVYLLSSLGEAMCIDLTMGASLWQVNILEQFKGPMNEWALAESLLVDGDRVICTPGGEDAALAALDKNTGETVWVTKGLTDMTSYASVGLAVHNGRRILLTMTSKWVVCADADTGGLLWKHEHPTEWDIHAITPVYHAGRVYYVAGYKSGGGVLELSPDASSYTVLWTDTELDCQHHGVVLVDGCIYGTSHHKSGSRLVCLDWETGKMLWDSKEVRQAAIVAADGMLYAYEGHKSGVVSLIKPSREGFERTGQFVMTAGTREHWAHPTIANGRLYIRHGDALCCYDITAK
ncbi:MAG: PQQ-binding-like beta-propeller repeat protein [Candidatus Hydrogenedens sp.]|nr:PQQ-like beta-propeller repeat protein [Candidatus Hydrogenedentota bacterium]NLF59072.1 PQQ-binding-like beta-propeller repeat protein [Candidatus Hydrogenedens sp.]